MNIIEKAQAFATEKHAGQFRFDGVTPYIRHPEDVARRVSNSHGATMEDIAVALGHDLKEDAGVTDNDLLEIGMPYHVVEAINILTKKEGQSYQEYLELVIQNPTARKVKIYDMLSNLSDSPSRKQVKKYAEGLSFLLNGII